MSSVVSAGHARARPLASAARWLARHQLLCLILFSSFVARLFLAGWKSYWYDEILSVAIYGANHATLASALKSLAGHSAHPPLYHLVLFYWMKLFGTAEVATRTLSNLYIAGATLCLYLLAERLFGRRVAIASTLLFAFSYTATFFGLEDRSYAQSLFLVTLSSLLLLRLLEGVGDFAGWRDMLAARAVPLLLCNIALLLTHYSNALFVIVQALFVAFFFGHRSQSGTRLKSFATVAGFYASQFAVALAIWGPVALATRKRFAAREEFVVHGHLPGHGPLKIFTDSVAGLFDLPALVVLAVLVLLAMVLIKSARRHFMHADKPPPVNQYFLFYLTGWAILPCFLTYLIFFASGWERYTARYFAFCVPAFSILIVLALEQLVECLASGQRRFRVSVQRAYLRNATLCALIACALLAQPGAYKAAKDPKGLYRDIARSIVTLVQRDPTRTLRSTRSRFAAGQC